MPALTHPGPNTRPGLLSLRGEGGDQFPGSFLREIQSRLLEKHCVGFHDHPCSIC
jgi:hypothetical protein